MLPPDIKQGMTCKQSIRVGSIVTVIRGTWANGMEERDYQNTHIFIDFHKNFKKLH